MTPSGTGGGVQVTFQLLLAHIETNGGALVVPRKVVVTTATNGTFTTPLIVGTYEVMVACLALTFNIVVTATSGSIDWMTLVSPPTTLTTWFVADATNGAPLASAYVAYSSFLAALTASNSFYKRNLVWGDLNAALTLDGSANFVLIGFTGIVGILWNWVIGTPGHAIADSNQNNTTAVAALAQVWMSSSLPSTFFS